MAYQVGLKMNWPKLNAMMRGVRKGRSKLIRTVRKELKRSTKDLVAESIVHLRAKSGIKKGHSTAPALIPAQVTWHFNKGHLTPEKMAGTVIFPAKGITLIKFVQGSVRVTRLKGIPVHKRTPPLIAVYKARRTRVRRTFILKRKSLGAGGFKLLKRTGFGQSSRLHMPRSISMGTILARTGFSPKGRAKKHTKLALKRIMAQKSYWMAGIAPKPN